MVAKKIIRFTRTFSQFHMFHCNCMADVVLANIDMKSLEVYKYHVSTYVISKNNCNINCSAVCNEARAVNNSWISM